MLRDLRNIRRKMTAFMGPQDPTQNRTLPPDIMAKGAPARLAIEMAENLD
jgi:hypothetical protein